MALHFNDAALEGVATVAALHLHPSFGSARPGVVLSGVFCDVKELQVCQAVVAAVVVDVVDVLVGSQSASQMLRHDVSVFEDVVAVNSDHDVAVIAGESPASPVRVSSTGTSPCRVRASATAIGAFASGDATGCHGETRAACGADSCDGHSCSLMFLKALSDLGNPDPYVQWMLSRISNPASSMAHAMR